MYGETAGGEHGGVARAQQYTPQPFNGFNMGQPIGYMQMGGTAGWPPGQVPYAPNTMNTPYQSSVYRMHSQQQYWTPPGPTTFQMAHNSMTKQMLLDQCVQMGILQYTGQHHQNQHQNQQHNQQHATEPTAAVQPSRHEDEAEQRRSKESL